MKYVFVKIVGWFGWPDILNNEQVYRMFETIKGGSLIMFHVIVLFVPSWILVYLIITITSSGSKYKKHLASCHLKELN